MIDLILLVIVVICSCGLGAVCTAAIYELKQQKLKATLIRNHHSIREKDEFSIGYKYGINFALEQMRGK